MFTKLGYFSLEKRNLTILFAIFFIPTLLLSYYGISKLNHYKTLESKIESFEILALKTASQRKKRHDFLMDHFDADPNYLENFAFSTQLLSKEKEDLQFLSSHKIFNEDDTIQKRKAFLSSQNKLKFQKDISKQKGQVKETRYYLNKEVEVSFEDIQDLLLNLELQKNIPQYILYGFQIDETKDSIHLSNVLILQREFFRKP